MRDLVWDPALPVGVIILSGVFLAVLTIAVYTRFFAKLGWLRNGLLLLLRLLGVALVVGLLMQPSYVEDIPPPVADQTLIVAVDNSRSMAQRDVPEGSRVDAATRLLMDSGAVKASGEPRDSTLRLFKFSDTAVPVSNAAEFDATGATTRFHASITSLFGSMSAHEGARALILLSDGHDFEWVNPAKTGLLARARQTPIYAVVLGKQGKVRDVSARIMSYQPYSYAKQKTLISASIRMLGCQRETIQVRLLREGKEVQTQSIRADTSPEVAVGFEVTENVAGQYEYEVEAMPLAGELDLTNNHAPTFLNVIDQQIRILLLEGEPYWDTSFLQRSLMRNEKMNVDSIVQYAQGKARIVRKTAAGPEIGVPTTRAQWGRYDVVVLGRAVEKLIGRDALSALEAYVEEDGGMLIFSRAHAFGGALSGNRLEPVIWGDVQRDARDVPIHVRVEPAREGAALAPFRLWAQQAEHPDFPMELMSVYRVLEKKPLAASLAMAHGEGESSEAMIHRRFGEGQVLSVGVDGLWRWAFNARIEGANTFFDRFWDQMFLWLLAGRDSAPTQDSALRASSANVPLGEKIYFRGALRRATQSHSTGLPLTVFRDGVEVMRTTLLPVNAAGDDSGTQKFSAEYVPEKVGRYQAQVTSADGQPQTVRFIVFEDNLEQNEVSTDSAYLQRLCEGSGGRLLAAADLSPLFKELGGHPVDATVQTRLVPAWDRAWIFWLVGILFGTDWFLRRHWGLW